MLQWFLQSPRSSPVYLSKYPQNNRTMISEQSTFIIDGENAYFLHEESLFSAPVSASGFHACVVVWASAHEVEFKHQDRRQKEIFVSLSVLSGKTTLFVVQEDHGGIPNEPELFLVEDLAKCFRSGCLITAGYPKLENESEDDHFEAFRDDSRKVLATGEKFSRQHSCHFDDYMIRFWEADLCEGLL